MTRPSWLPQQLLVATHNPGKLAEWRSLLQPLGVTVLTPDETGISEPEETEETYRGNALLKARAAAEHTGLGTLADDTGFEVDALGGLPGVRSARWASAHGGHPNALAELWRRAAGPSPARMVCAVALVINDLELVEESDIRGTLRWPPTDVPGFAALLAAGTPLMSEGVFAHRRAAFDRIISR